MRRGIFGTLRVAVAGGCAALSCAGAEFLERFEAAPEENGWQVAGPGDLFQWDSDLQHLAVEWDSSQPNSYFFFAMPQPLTQADSFSVELDLVLQRIEIGTTPEKPFTFQFAFGFLNLEDATDPNFFRAAGANATYGPKNLVESDYFPDSGFGATVAATAVSEENRFAIAHTHPLELTVEDRFGIKLSYGADERQLSVSMTKNGQPFGLGPDSEIKGAVLGDPFPFEVNAFAIMNYNDGKQSPPQFAGSIQAAGYVDNIHLQWPDPPEVRIVGMLREAGEVEVEVDLGRAQPEGEVQLQRSVDLSEWQTVDRQVPLEAGAIVWLRDAAAPVGFGFYRVAVGGR